LSAATAARASARRTIVVVAVHGAVSVSLRESETTTFRSSLLRRPISRCSSAREGSAATSGDAVGSSATAGQYAFRRR
jgi:hypothetical protein